MRGNRNWDRSSAGPGEVCARRFRGTDWAAGGVVREKEQVVAEEEVPTSR